MADHEERTTQDEAEERTLPGAPTLLHPREQEVVDGRAVRFAWEHDGVGVYGFRLEVAADSAFEQVVHAEDLPENARETTVEGQFGQEGATFYWRVVTKGEERWSHGQVIESFLATTPEVAATHAARPEEDLGPYPELIKTAGVEGAAELTGDEDLEQRELEEGVEPEGIPAGQILGLIFALLAAIAAIIFVVFNWVSVSQIDARDEVTGISGYPELRETEVEAARLLTQYDIVNDQERIYRIPIDRAMDLMVNETLEERRARGEVEPAPAPPSIQEGPPLVTPAAASGGASDAASEAGIAGGRSIE